MDTITFTIGDDNTITVNGEIYGAKNGDAPHRYILERKPMRKTLKVIKSEKKTIFDKEVALHLAQGENGARYLAVTDTDGKKWAVKLPAELF